MTKMLLLIFISTLWGTIGHILFKKSVDKLEQPNLRSLGSYSSFAFSIIKMPMIWFGIVFVAIGVVFYIFALALGDLSVVYPVDSMRFLVTMYFSRIFLGEKIDRMKLVGTLLVFAGIILVAMS